MSSHWDRMREELKAAGHPLGGVMECIDKVGMDPTALSRGLRAMLEQLKKDRAGSQTGEDVLAKFVPPSQHQRQKARKAGKGEPAREGKKEAKKS